MTKLHLILISCCVGFSVCAENTNSTTTDTTDTQIAASGAGLIWIALEVLAFIAAYIIKQTKFKYLQEAGATMLIGVIFGAILRLSSAERLKELVNFKADIFFLILLPPIIFESGYNMQRRSFFQNFGSILGYAVLGTTISTFVIGGLLYVCVIWGLTTTKLELLDCFIWGALISATDPVTVLAIFKELRVDIDLYSNVFGESVLNDAVAIVLYNTIYAFKTQPLNAKTFFLAIASFCYIFLGSLVLGLVIGLLFSLLTKWLNLSKYLALEMSLLVLFAYSSYLIAEIASLSGIAAIMFCGIAMAYYAWENLSPEVRELSSNFFGIWAMLTETLIFGYLGLALFSFDEAFDIGFIICGIVVMLVARAAQVFPISWFVNWIRPKETQISWKYQLFIWYSGLRGGIAFALSLSTPGPIGIAMFSTTLVIIIFTVVVQGGLTVPILIKLGIPIGVNYDEIVAQRNAKYEDKFLQFDNKFLQPFFTNKKYSPPSDHSTQLELSVLEQSRANASALEVSVEHHDEHDPPVVHLEDHETPKSE